MDMKYYVYVTNASENNIMYEHDNLRSAIEQCKYASNHNTCILIKGTKIDWKSKRNEMENVEKPSNKTPLIYSQFDDNKRIRLRSELEILFNKLGIDSEMNMPDFILAEMVDNFIMTIYNANNA